MKKTNVNKVEKIDVWAKMRKQVLLGRHVCVELNPILSKLPGPQELPGKDLQKARAFVEEVVSVLYDFAAAIMFCPIYYKALDKQFGWAGDRLIEEICNHIKKIHPETFLILDSRIDEVNAQYLEYIRKCGVDAVTAHAFRGKEAFRSILDSPDKGLVVITKTENPGSGELQEFGGDRKLYEQIANNVFDKWNQNRNCGILVESADPETIKNIRHFAPNTPILVSQSEGAEFNSEKLASIVSSVSSERGGFLICSTDVIYSGRKNFKWEVQKAVQRLNSEIATHLSAI